MEYPNIITDSALSTTLIKAVNQTVNKFISSGKRIEFDVKVIASYSIII